MARISCGGIEMVIVLRCITSTLALVAIMSIELLCARGRAAAPAAQLYEDVIGTVGPDRIGMTLTTAEGRVAIGSHYFYQRSLQDIALTGTMGETVTLQDPSGAVFRLHYVCKGSEALCDAYHSIGLSGVWEKGARSLPVRLQSSSISLFVPGHRYEQVTEQQDSQSEALIQGFQKAVLGHRALAAAQFIRFPLRINTRPGRYFMIATPEQLESKWDEIFPINWISMFREVVPHDMPVIQGKIMLGNGLAFVGAAGVEVVNMVR